MNIFASNDCPVKSAQDLTSVLVNKMIVEGIQLLSTAHHELDGTIVAYKPTHKNHPSAIWTRETSENYKWLLEHTKALCNEYTFRRGKVHKSSEHIPALSKLPKNIRIGERSPFALVMPEQFQAKGIFDQTKAYREYLNAKYAEWTGREKPIKVCFGLRGKPDWVN